MIIEEIKLAVPLEQLPSKVLGNYEKLTVAFLSFMEIDQGTLLFLYSNRFCKSHLETY